MSFMLAEICTKAAFNPVTMYLYWPFITPYRRRAACACSRSSLFSGNTDVRKSSLFNEMIPNAPLLMMSSFCASNDDTKGLTAFCKADRRDCDAPKIFGL